MKQKNLTTNTTIPPKRLEPQNSPPLFELWVTVILPPRSPTQPPPNQSERKRKRERVGDFLVIVLIDVYVLLYIKSVLVRDSW